MKEPAPQRSDRRAAPKEKVALKRLDLELPDGRYLLVYSRKPRA